MDDVSRQLTAAHSADLKQLQDQLQEAKMANDENVADLNIQMDKLREAHESELALMETQKQQVKKINLNNIFY